MTLAEAAQAVVDIWANNGSLEDLTPHIEQLELVLAGVDDEKS